MYSCSDSGSNPESGSDSGSVRLGVDESLAVLSTGLYFSPNDAGLYFFPNYAWSPHLDCVTVSMSFLHLFLDEAIPNGWSMPNLSLVESLFNPLNALLEARS